MFAKQNVLKAAFVIILMLLIGSVEAQSSTLTEFRITPVDGTRLVRRPDMAYPVQYSGNSLLLAVQATDGPVRFTARNTISGAFVVLGESAQSDYSLTISNFDLAADQPVEFCAWSGGSNGWSNADTQCATLFLVMGRGCVPVAENGDGCPSDFPDYEPLEYYRLENQSVYADCSGALAPTIPLDMQGRVTFTNGDPTGVYDRPQGTVIHRMPEGTEFTVIGGPVCTDARNGHLWWSEVETSDGITGWSAYGYIGTPYWIEPMPIEMSSSDGHVKEFVYHQLWDIYYILEIDPENCWIVNGAEVMSLELSLLESWLDSASNAVDRNYMAYNYFRPAIPYMARGYVEQLREQIEWVFEDNDCDRGWYQVGTKAVDLSALGNIAFGFYAERYDIDWEFSDWVANTDQFVNPQSLGQGYDNADDLVQRLVGHALAREDNITTESFLRVAERMNLQ